MSDMPLPDFVDISSEAQDAAKAATNFNSGPLKVPDTATTTVSSKGDTYHRWVEEVSIQKAWREAGKNGLVSAVLLLKSRPGMPNEHSSVFARHQLSVPIMTGSADETVLTKYQAMHDRSINALDTLLSATGFKPDVGGISGKLLNYLFPIKNQPGAKSPLIGKILFANLVDCPNKGANAKSNRQTNVDSYLPE